MYDYIITKPPLDEDTLAHYGVPGMKWGIRKRIDAMGKNIGDNAINKRKRKQASGKWGSSKGSNSKRARYMAKDAKLTRSKKWREEKNTTAAGKNIMKNTARNAALVGGATLAAQYAGSKAINYGLKKAGLDVGGVIKARPSAARIARNAALAGVGTAAVQYNKYAKYGKIKTKRFKDNRGK